MKVTAEKNEKIGNLIFASIYPLYLDRLEKNGRTKEEFHRVIEWFTGFDEDQLQVLIDEKATFRTFFEKADIHRNAHLIKGVVCGYRIEEIEDEFELYRQCRQMEKLIDELARGRKMEKILREEKSRRLAITAAKLIFPGRVGDMQIVSLLLGALMTIFSCNAPSKHPFNYEKPESQGYSSEKLEVLRAHLKQSGSSSMIVMVDGNIIFEWGETGKKLLIHSMRKAILNSLYGIAIARGQVDTTQTLQSMNIDDIEPELSEEESKARISDLLKSRSGIYHNAAAVNNAMLHDRPERGTHDPGEYYYYNNWDFNTLGAILEQQTGESMYTMFLNEIARPLGMDYDGTHVSIDGEGEGVERPKTDGFYQYEKSQSMYPAYHFRMSARDLALYGQLYLNYGIWNGKQIIPRDWIDVSTQPYSIYDPEYGNAYGMLWRVRVPDENTNRNSFYHTGLGIHMLGVYPDSKMVMVHRVDTEGNYEYNQGDFYKMLGLLFDARESK